MSLFIIKLFIIIKPTVKHFKSHWLFTLRPSGRKKTIMRGHMHGLL